MWWEPVRGLVFRSLLSHVDSEGELESPTMSQGEPLPRPFLHHSQCLLYRGLSDEETQPMAAILEVLSWAVNIWLYFLRTCSFLCWFWPRKITVNSLIYSIWVIVLITLACSLPELSCYIRVLGLHPLKFAFQDSLSGQTKTALIQRLHLIQLFLL